MLNGMITAEQLQATTGYDRLADVCRSLDEQRIRYFRGKGGKPWTTIDLINAAAGLAPVVGTAANEGLLSADDA